MYGLTEAELKVMEALWNSKSGISFQDLLDYMNGSMNRQWKRQTLSTYLKDLQKKNLVDFCGKRKSMIYFACCSRDEHIHKWTRELVESSYGNSLEKFVSAFIGNNLLTRDEAKEIRNLLDDIYVSEN